MRWGLHALLVLFMLSSVDALFRQWFKRVILRKPATTIGASGTVECTYKNKSFDITISLKEYEKGTDNSLTGAGFRGERDSFNFDIDGDLIQISGKLWPYLHINHSCTRYGQFFVYDEPLTKYGIPNDGFVHHVFNVNIVLGQLTDRLNRTVYDIEMEKKSAMFNGSLAIPSKKLSVRPR